MPVGVARTATFPVTALLIIAGGVESSEALSNLWDASSAFGQATGNREAGGLGGGKKLWA
jgi:hypothetical protein